MNKDLEVRTPGEEVACWRRWKGYREEEACMILGLGRTRLQAAVRDHRPLSRRVQPTFSARGEARTAVLLWLARRRTGLGMHATAALVGCCHVTLLKREAEADPALKKFWEGRGFTFVRDGERVPAKRR